MLPKFTNPRLKFPEGKQREFIEKVLLKSKLNANSLSEIAGVSPRTIRDWKREKFNITERAVSEFCNVFDILGPKNKTILINKWQRMRLKTCKNGGVACFKKYGNPGTPEGRKKGGIRTLAILREKGVIPKCNKYLLPKHHSIRLAEFVGIVLGDGGITNEKLTITLNSEADHEYINYVTELGNYLFGSKPKTRRKMNDKAIDLNYYGVQLIKYLIKLGLKVGNKVKQQVGVPDWVYSSNQYKLACTRGLMDTDGGVFIHKYIVNGKLYSYKNICFSNQSLPLLRFVYGTLKEVGLTPKIKDKIENKKVWLYNTNEVGQYLEIVGSSNQRLLKKGGVDGQNGYARVR